MEPWSERLGTDLHTGMKAIFKGLLILILFVSFGTGCGKVKKWYAERKAQQERYEKQSQAGLAQRKKYFEQHLPETTRKLIPDAFYTYDGFRDWWRVPLVFPYQLIYVDVTDKARLEKYNPAYPIEDPNKSSSHILRYIIRLKTDNKLLLFEISDDNGNKHEYRLFEYSTGLQSTFNNESDMWKAAVKAGFSGTNILITPDELLKSYYAYEKSFVEQENKSDK